MNWLQEENYIVDTTTAMVKAERAFFIVKPGDGAVATTTKSTTHPIRRKNSGRKSRCIAAFNKGRLGIRASGDF